MKNVATVQGFWTLSDQTLIQNHNKSEVFRAMLTCVTAQAAFTIALVWTCALHLHIDGTFHPTATYSHTQMFVYTLTHTSHIHKNNTLLVN